MKLIFLTLVLLLASADAFRLVMAACCTTACAAQGVAFTAATGGVGVGWELFLGAACVAECIPTGVIIPHPPLPITPIPACIWALPIPV